MKKTAANSTSGKSLPNEFCGVSEDQILLRIEGGESISCIAASLGKNRSVLWRWLQSDEQRSARAKASREVSAQAYDELAEKVIREAADVFELSRAKEIAHHYRWRASKIAPKVYGDRTTVAGDPEAPIETKQTLDASSLPTEVLAAIMKAKDGGAAN